MQYTYIFYFIVANEPSHPYQYPVGDTNRLNAIKKMYIEVF